MQGLILAAVAVAVVVVAGIVWGVVRTMRAASLSRRLMEATPMTGRVVASEIVTSNFYVHSGSAGDHGPVNPVGRRHLTKRVETIEYVTADGRVLRGSPAFTESGLPDRSGQEVPVHVDPQRPTVFVAPIGASMSMGSVYLRMWGPILFGVVLVCIFLCVFGVLFGTPSPGPPGP